ncbi:orexin/Hypocretin receptor type 1-like [Saccostrea echinata]|uniref:orexin/Hypocretin receptor type 1-like n=1 Tax=Saccostrea echinata TaxID=191078 RepID=UPI002A80E7DC|nr:orexin/Hypocretin receptor type 1-like [Saccostrea echinata]
MESSLPNGEDSTKYITTFSIIKNISNFSNFTKIPIKESVKRSCNDSYLTPTTYLELDALSDDRAMTYMPVIFFLIIVMLFGIFGNLLVLYIYCSDSKRKPANNFIITMALFDFLASGIAIPLDIYDMRYHYTFYNRIACKVFRYSESAFTNASSFILILIAIDRYLKICKPLMFETPLRSKLMCVGATLFGFFIAIPAFWLFGINRKVLYFRKYCGFDCTVSDKYRNTRFNKIYYTLLLGLFFLTVVMLIGFYVRIWIAIKTRRNSVIGDHASISHSSVKSNDSKESGQSFMKRKRNQSCTSDDDSVFDSKQVLNRQQSCASRKSRVARMGSSVSTMIGNVRCSRSTKIFIAVSAAYILCFLPSITVNLLQASVKSIQMTKSVTIKVTIKFLARVHFVNHAINPLIYSFLNVNFRVQCKKVFKRMTAACTEKLFKRSASITSRSSRNGSRKTPKTESDVKTNEEEMEHLNKSQVETKNL